MFQGFTGWHALIILVVVVLLFGATKLPALAKSVGQSMKIFRSEMKTGEGDEKAADAGASDDSPSTPKQ
jgi:sec-independent protein translocase protein TatA